MSSDSEAPGKILNPFLSTESNDNVDSWLCTMADTENEVPRYNGPEFRFMDCFSCKLKSYSPVYFCSKGHVFCYRCAANSEFCSLDHRSEKIRKRNILPYDEEFNLKTPVQCCRHWLGCLRQVFPKNYLQHVQFACSFRTSMNCFMNNCKVLEPEIYWGFIDTHMASFHGSFLKKLSPTCSGQSIQIPYHALEEGKTLNPLVCNSGNARKFIPSIKKNAGKIYFWIDMIEDGYVHDYQNSQFHATIKVQSKEPITYEGIVKPVKKLEDAVIADKGIDFDVVDFEKKYLFPCEDPYFVVEIGIEERKIVFQAKPEEESKGYGDLPADINEDLDAALKNISHRDIIFPNYMKINYEVPEKVPVDVRGILAKREEAEKQRIIAEYQEYLKQPKLDVDYDYFNEAFPDKTPKEAEKEKASIEKHHQAAIESGKLTVADINCLEKNFTWTAADVEILESFGRNGFSRLPTVQSGFYFKKFLQYQMETYFSAQQEKFLFRDKRGSFFY